MRVTVGELRALVREAVEGTVSQDEAQRILSLLSPEERAALVGAVEGNLSESGSSALQSAVKKVSGILDAIGKHPAAAATSAVASGALTAKLLDLDIPQDVVNLVLVALGASAGASAQKLLNPAKK